jgi:hypothetical protein
MQSIPRSMAFILAGALLLLFTCLAALFMLDGKPTHSSWLYNATGYQQAVYRGQQNDKPRLLWLEQSEACPRCAQLDQRLWQDPHFMQELGSWQLIRLQQDADAATAELIARYAGEAELPVVILEQAAVSRYQTIHFNRELTAFSLAADPKTAALPLDAEHLQQALTNWLRTTQSPSQFP